jgi:hypothetical protein
MKSLDPIDGSEFGGSPVAVACPPVVTADGGAVDVPAEKDERVEGFNQGVAHGRRLYHGTVELRKLDPDRDELLVREAVSWIEEQPRFYKDAALAWDGGDTAEDYLELMRAEPQADFGVFEGRWLVAVITVTLEGRGVYNSHLMVKKGTNPLTVAQGVSGVLKGLLAEGMREGWSWLAAKNVGARRILEAVGMKRDGVVRFKGQSRGRPIEWVRYGVRT